jgi:diketogulonate reductase-like aldo/keto reductase
MKRRTLLQAATVAVAPSAFAQSAVATKPIPSTAEPMPVIGLGTWITFNVGRDAAARAECAQVVRNFLDLGGRMIDSSPMYGSSQDVVGDALSQLPNRERVFATDKVWTSGDGAAQLEASRKLWRVQRFDLLQVHNLLAWERQLPLLFEMKERQRVRYVGTTTSEGRRPADFERIMRGHKLDFVQLTYNIVDREAEDRLLPLARERGIAVIANRPFREGELTRKLARQPLPGWAKEIGCMTWAQALLKFIVSQPAAARCPTQRCANACRPTCASWACDAMLAMSEWWTYRLSDFLMFSPRTYWRLVDGYNREMWPMQAVVLVAAVALLWLAMRGSRRWVAAVHVLFALAWANVGWSFFAERYSQIFTGASYPAVACGVQAVALLGAALASRPVQGRAVPWWLAMACAVLYPEFTGAAEWFGFMPDPTALATVPFAWAVARGRVVAIGLAVIPVFVLAVGWATRVNLAAVGGG